MVLTDVERAAARGAGAAAAGRVVVRGRPPYRAVSRDRVYVRRPVLPPRAVTDPGRVISDVGRALSALVRPALPAAAVVRLGPATDGASGAAVHLALRWVRDDTSGRLSGARDVRADDGTLLGRQGPPRRYELQFVVTAAAGTVEEEYELLDAVLLAVAGLDAIPAEHLSKSLVDTGLPVLLSVSAAAPASGSPAGFTLLVSAPVLPPVDTELAPPAAEMAMGLRRTHRVPPPATASGVDSGRRWRRATIHED